ncbi:MAG: TonB family protein [bacterium]|nr:TonB family protein [bacterium]
MLLALAGIAGAAANYTAPVPAEPLEPPAYPPGAAAAGFEGECRVSLLINGAGKVSEAWIAQSSGREDVDLAALETAEATLWKPATLEGVPVSSRLTIPYRFELGVLPGDPLGPALPAPSAEPESSEPLVELTPREPISVDYLGEGFAVIGLEVDEVGLVLDAWLIRSSGRQAADDELLNAAYSVCWEGVVPENGLVRGVYVHDFSGRTAASMVESSEEAPPEEPTTDETGGACQFDQLKLGKYGERTH